MQGRISRHGAAGGGILPASRFVAELERPGGRDRSVRPGARAGRPRSQPRPSARGAAGPVHSGAPGSTGFPDIPSGCRSRDRRRGSVGALHPGSSGVFRCSSVSCPPGLEEGPRDARAASGQPIARRSDPGRGPQAPRRGLGRAAVLARFAAGRIHPAGRRRNSGSGRDALLACLNRDRVVGTDSELLVKRINPQASRMEQEFR